MQIRRLFMRYFNIEKLLFFTALLLCPSIGFAVSTIEELRASRLRLPSVAAIYIEALRVPNSEPEKDNPEQRSWGNSDSDRFFLCGFGAKKSFLKELSKPSLDAPEFAEAMTFLVEEDGITHTSTSGGRQGVYGKRPTGHINPISRHFEIRIGESWASLVEPYDLTSEGSGETYTRDSESILLKIEKYKDQVYVAGGESEFKDFKFEWAILAWDESGGVRIPKKITEKRYKGGSIAQELTYTLVERVKSPEQMLKLPEWKNGAIVRNEDTGVVQVFKNGKFEVDPRFAGSKRSLLGLSRALIVAGAILIGSILIITTRVRRRRRIQVS
jgi:hypothetical protein